MEGKSETSLFKRSNRQLYSIALNTRKGDQWVAGCLKVKHMVITITAINSCMDVVPYG